MTLSLPPSPIVRCLVGNPKPRSRTLRAAAAVGEAIARSTGGRVDEVVDLIEMRSVLFDIGDATVKALISRLLESAVIVVASPVYKASYSAVLKAFFDHVGAGQLAGRLAVPMMVGGAPGHTLAVEAHLRPMLVEVGATTVTPGLYVLESEIESIDAIAAAYVAGLRLRVDEREAQASGQGAYLRR
ncbi:MAG TPA: NADPH-dependent FMN reductase [Candidatus Limnocylindria bacterium]